MDYSSILNNLMQSSSTSQPQMAGYIPSMNPMGDTTGQPAQPSNEDIAKELWSKTTKEYPYLADKNIPIVYTPGQGAGFLETWNKTEPGSEQDKRPEGLPLGSHGIQVRNPDTGPKEILGDYLSHVASKVDPETGKPEDPKFYNLYKKFEETMQTPEMKKRLEKDYKFEKKEQEKLKAEGKPYLDIGTKEHYIENNRIPAYMRGYVTDQWDSEWNQSWMNSKQKRIMDQMKAHVKGE
jgi:hypothetical protein